MTQQPLPVSEDKIRAMVRELLEKSSKERSIQSIPQWTPPVTQKKASVRDFQGWVRHGFRGVFSSIDAAVNATHEAQRVWVQMKLEHRRFIIEKIREALRSANDYLSREAVVETGLGRVDDKLKKNLLVIDKTPGIEFLDSHVQTGDDGLVLTEY